MSVRWPSAPRRAPRAASDWVRKVPTEDLHVLRAVAYLTRGADAVPPWAEPLVARIREAADRAPDPPPEPERPGPDPIWSGDFEAALAAAWPGAIPAEREALRVVAAALGVEVPPDAPEVPEDAPEVAQDTPPEDECREEPEPPSQDAHTPPTDAPADEPHAPSGPERPRDFWQRLWAAEPDRSDEDLTPLGYVNDL